MKKKTAFVKISGSLLSKHQKKVFLFLQAISQFHDLTIVVGGGKQINKAFKEADLLIEFSPLGRICHSERERKLVRKVLEDNKAFLAKKLKKKAIKAKLVLPIIKIGKKACHVNGDVMVLSAYVSYDQIFILTLNHKAAKKMFWVEKLGNIFSEMQPQKNFLKKITIIGF